MGLKDLFFVEERPITPRAVAVDVPVVNAINIEAIDASGVVSAQEIYKDSVIGTEAGIYKIIAFIEGLPSSMDSVAKKETLLKMLSAAGFDVDLLHNDAVARIDVLKSYEQATNDYVNSENLRINDEISELKNAISILEEDLRAKQENAKQQIKVVNEEVSKVKSLQSYIE